MCFFKKKKEVIVSKYQMGQLVRFKYKGEMAPGYIYKIDKDQEGNIIYSIQIGGECPAIIDGVKEDTIHPGKVS